MFKNYLKTAWRNITRRKLFAIINVLCLAIGLCFALIIGVYIVKQKSVNQQFKDVANQYIIQSKWSNKDIGSEITTLAPFPQILKEEYPNLVKNYYRYNPVTNVVSVGDEFFKENIAIGDTSFVSMFGLPILYGNSTKAFDNINSAVVTASFAKKMFGTENALGKTISVQTIVGTIKQDYTISAILKDLPYNSVFNNVYDGYNVFVSNIGNKYYGDLDPLTNWGNNSCLGMVELNNGVSPQDLMLPSQKIIAKYASDFYQKNLTVKYASVKDFYLNDNNGAVARMIKTLALIGGFILLMAIFNFVNISMATANYRIKEIGIRKVFGSARRQLAFQFLCEAWILTLAGGALALVLYELLRSYFSQIFGVVLISINDFTAVYFIAFLSLVIVIGFLAGAYPAFALSRSNVVTSVKGKLGSISNNLLFRRTVLVIQFSMAILVFIGAAIIGSQVNYIFNKDIGYNKEQLLVATAFPKRWDSTGVKNMERIKKGLLQLPEVSSATLTFDSPDRIPANSSIDFLSDKGGTTPLQVPSFVADEDYAQTFQIKMQSGIFLNYKKNFVQNLVVLNETAAKLLDLDINTAVGKKVRTAQGNVYTVSGIIRDYNSSSLRDAIAPLAIFHVKDAPGYRFLIIKLNRADAATIAKVKAQWMKLSPQSPFEYTFMDENFAALYKSEVQLKKATSTATVLSLLIVFLGIFGVVSVMLMRREKEIAVRKTLGAGVKNIFALFIKEYAGLFLIANILSWPLAYYFMNRWLAGYAYRTQQHVSTYMGVAIIVLVLITFLICLRTFRAATANPVKALRSE